MIRINSDILSLPLSFEPGSYSITEFIVQDAAGKTLALAPKAGSAVSGLVSQTLDIPFTITAETTNRVSIEVVGAGTLSASDFGYSTFSFISADLSSFLLSAFAYSSTTNPSNFQLTTATATILNETTNKSYGVISMLASTTVVAYPTSANVNDVIKITVEKAGYKTEVVTKTLAYLKTTLTAVPAGAGPLIVVLYKGATFRGRHVIHFDAADPRSYLGSGTTWTNLATNTHHGTINGATHVATGVGYFTLNGINDYISTTKNGQPLAWTVGVWFRSTGTKYGVIFSNIEGTGENTENGFNLEINPTGTFVSNFVNNRIDFRTGGIVNTTTVNDGQWHHVGWSFNGTNNSAINIRLDGVLTTYTSSTAGTTQSDGPIHFGRYSKTTPGPFFQGDIAKFEMYDGAMTPVELQTLYDSQKARFGK